MYDFFVDLFCRNKSSSQKKNQIKIFADDTKIYNSVNSYIILLEDLLALSKWSDQWLLPFNVDKCKVLHYGKHNTNNDYQKNNIAIPMDDIMKDLGVRVCYLARARAMAKF